MAVLTTKKICMVTYLRDTESFTEDLYSVANSLFIHFHNEFKVVICCDKHLKPEEFVSDYPVEFFYCPGTKYHRLLSLINEDRSEFFLSVDNDIKGNHVPINSFMSKMISKSYDIGWGRIKAVKQSSLIANIVYIDKLFSHNIIRPLLWKIHCGISVPGQIFCLKGDSYRGKTIQADTFLDDLALGLYTAQSSKIRYVTKNVLGYEIPNVSFIGLWNQRRRWAIGFVTIFNAVDDMPGHLLLLIHCICYHFLWIFHWIIIAMLASQGTIYSVIYVSLWAFILTISEPRMFFWGVLYQLIFPIFHIKWISELVKNFFISQEA